MSASECPAARARLAPMRIGWHAVSPERLRQPACPTDDVRWERLIAIDNPGVRFAGVNSLEPRPGERQLGTQRLIVGARDVDAGAFLQSFLVTAVAAMLLTRLYLELTGFPRLGGGGLHIAHLLWGGLLMLLALVLLLTSLGKRTKRIASIVGGAGFGLFLDELGKFVTSDNDYFFQPTIALIYVVFVTLFFAFRAYERRTLSPEEQLVNAADMIKELILGGATTAEVARSLTLLYRSRAQGPLADGLHAAIEGISCDPDRPPSVWSAVALRAWLLYDTLIGWRWFQRAVLVAFLAQAIVGVAGALILGTAAFQGRAITLDRLALPPLRESLGIAGPAASIVSLGLGCVGVFQLRRTRLGAYHWFERSVLVAILITQVVQFWQDQLTALSGLTWNLFLLNVLRYMVRQEEARGAVAATRGASKPAPDGMSQA